MAKDIFDVDDKNSKDLFSSKDTDAFNKRAEIRNSAKNFNKHGYEKSVRKYEEAAKNTAKNTAQPKSVNEQNSKAAAHKDVSSTKKPLNKSIFGVIKIVLFIVVLVNFAKKGALFKEFSSYNKNKYFEEVEVVPELVSESEPEFIAEDFGNGAYDNAAYDDAALDEAMTTGDSVIDGIIEKRASFWSEEHRVRFDETFKDYKRRIFDNIIYDIEKSKMPEVKERLLLEDKNLLVEGESVYDCLSDEQGRYLCVLDAVNNDYNKVFDYRGNPTVSKALDELSPIFGIANRGGGLTIFSIEKGIAQDFEIDLKVSDDNKIVIKGLYNNSKDKSFYQSTDEFLTEFNDMAVDDVDKVLSKNRNIKDVLKQYGYSYTYGIEGFDDAMRINGSKMLQLPNDERILKIFKSFPPLFNINLKYDKGMDCCYIYVSSYYPKMEFCFEIEPKLSEKNKIVIKKML